MRLFIYKLLKTFLVDDENYEELSKHNWNVNGGKNNRYYVTRHTRIKGKNEYFKITKKEKIKIDQAKEINWSAD